MRIKIPFFTTSLQSDIFLVWLLLPLWYILGIDQIIWPILAFFLTLKILLLKINKKQFIIPNHAFFKAAILFLITYIISGVFVYLLNLEYKLYFKNLMLYYAGFIFLVSIINFTSKGETLKLIKVLCFIGIGSVIINLMAMAGVLQYDFKGFVTHIMPDSLSKSEYIEQITHKYPFEIKDIFYNLGFSINPRPRSIFITANFFAGFLLMLLFLILYFFFITKHMLKKVLLLVFLILSFFSLFTTLSKSALLGLIGGMIWLLYKQRVHLSAKILIIISLTILTLFITYFLGMNEAFIQRLTTGSTARRLIIYNETFHEILRYPIFGHGTVMRFPDDPNIDMGSHSTILHIAFSQGILGLIFYLVMIGSIFFGLLKMLRLNLLKQDRRFMEMLSFCFISLSIQCLFVTWQYDAIYFMAIWTLWGVIIKNLLIMKKKYVYG